MSGSQNSQCQVVSNLLSFEHPTRGAQFSESQEVPKPYHSRVSPDIDISPYFGNSDSESEASCLLPEISSTRRGGVQFIKKTPREVHYNYGNEYPPEREAEGLEPWRREALKSQFEQALDLMQQSPQGSGVLRQGLRELKQRKFFEEAAVGMEYSKFVL